MANVNGTISLKSVRLSEDNKNLYEAVKGQWGQYGDEYATFTVIKNILFINLHSGAKYDGIKLPFECYDGFIQLSNGTRIQIKDSILTCNLSNNVNGYGILVLKKWN